MATISGYLAALDRLAHTLDGYENDVHVRCDPNANKRDCSTFVAFGLIDAGFGGVNRCENSFGFAAMCHDQPRPDWFTARYGEGVGTFISHDQALHVVCWGLEGSDFARRPTSSGGGHIETSLGNGGGSIGAHSHATGIGYSQLDWHNCNWFAVPPMFLAEMAPPAIDAATLAALTKLVEWRKRVADRPLRQGDHNGDVTILNQLLIKKHLLERPANTYTKATRDAVHHFKVARGLSNDDGTVFGAEAAAAILTAQH